MVCAASDLEETRNINTVPTVLPVQAVKFTTALSVTMRLLSLRSDPLEKTRALNRNEFSCG